MGRLTKEKIEVPLRYGVMRALGVVVLLMAAISAFYANNDAKVATRTIVSPSGVVQGSDTSTDEAKRGLELQGTPGERLRFSIQRDSVKGEWATEKGLTLALDGRSSVLVEPRKKRWGDSIAYSTRRSDHDYKINTAITVPSSAEPGDTVEGRITGKIIRPGGSGSGFSDTSDTVDIPINITVVTAEVSSEGRPNKYETSVLIRNISLAVGALAIIVILLSYVLQLIYIKRFRRGRMVQ